MSNYCNKGHWEANMQLPCKQCRIEELERLNTFASYDAKVAELKAELYAISVALNDPRTDLTLTMVEVIKEQKKERDQLHEQVKMLRNELNMIYKLVPDLVVFQTEPSALAAAKPK